MSCETPHFETEPPTLHGGDGIDVLLVDALQGGEGSEGGLGGQQGHEVKNGRELLEEMVGGTQSFDELRCG